MTCVLYIEIDVVKLCLSHFAQSNKYKGLHSDCSTLDEVY